MPETLDDRPERAEQAVPEVSESPRAEPLRGADAAASALPDRQQVDSERPQLDAERPQVDADRQQVDADWRRVSPKYLVVEIIGSIIGLVIFVGIFLAIHFLLQQQWALWVAIAIGVVSLIGLAFEPRRVRSIGYRLRDDDLLFIRGIMFQRQVAVPYGRMQLVDITRGPVARALGLADLKFVTAAASTAVTVPGLPMEEADRLRDELVALAETRRAGL